MFTFDGIGPGIGPRRQFILGEKRGQMDQWERVASDRDPLVGHDWTGLGDYRASSPSTGGNGEHDSGHYKTTNYYYYYHYSSPPSSYSSPHPRRMDAAMPATTRPRAHSVSLSDQPSPKKLKSSHLDTPDDVSLRECFAGGVLDDSNVHRLAESYRSSEPYLYAVLDKLFKDDLLSKVKDECIGELSFTEKETDIYKVRIAINSVAKRCSPRLTENVCDFRCIKQATWRPYLISQKKKSPCCPTCSSCATRSTHRLSATSSVKSRDAVPSRERNRTCP